MVLAGGEDDFAVAIERERVADEIDGLGRPSHEHDLVGPGADEPRGFEACRVVQLRRLLPQRVNAAVNVRGAMLVVVEDGVDHRT